jgi:hypothetical protein
VADHFEAVVPDRDKALNPSAFSVGSIELTVFWLTFEFKEGLSGAHVS